MSSNFSKRQAHGSRPVPVLGELSDEQLMLEVQQGNGDAFTILFDRYNRLVLTVALRIVRDAAEAQEVTQDVFFEFYRTAKRFDPAKGSTKVWLLQFAYHRSINRRNYLLLRQFYNRPDLEEVLTWEASTQTSPRIPAQELRQVMEEVLRHLPEAPREVIEKVVFEGLTLREVSERTGRSFDSVRNHYYRGLDRMRHHLLEKPSSEVRQGILGLGEVRGGRA